MTGEGIDAEQAAEQASEIVRARVLKAVKRIGGELIRDLQDRVSVPNPLPWDSSSKDGEYPRMRTGSFRDGLTLTYDEDAQALRLYSYAESTMGKEDHHGAYLQGVGGPGRNQGLRDGTTRPYATKIVEEQDWVGRIAEAVRSMDE